MESHLLFELIYVFHRICSAIIHDERRLVELSREFCLFYLSCERWLRNLTQCFFHNISSHSLARRASAFPSVKALFIIGEGFAWWSSWLLSVHSVLFIIGRDMWETAPPARFMRMLGQTHVNGWSRVIASQNGGSTSYIFPLRLGVLQWSRHLFNYLDK